MDGYPESINGFLVALENCVIAYRQDFGIPDEGFPWGAPQQRDKQCR